MSIEIILEYVIFILGYNICFGLKPIKIISKEFGLRSLGLLMMLISNGIT